MTGETFEHVANTLLDCLKNNGPFDAVCLALGPWPVLMLMIEKANCCGGLETSSAQIYLP